MIYNVFRGTLNLAELNITFNDITVSSVHRSVICTHRFFPVCGAWCYAILQCHMM